MPIKKAKKKKTAKATRPVGHPTKYKIEYCQAIIDYFDIPRTDSKGNANTPPYILNFCLSIGISKNCLHEWVAKYPEFNDAYRIAKDKQKQLMIDNALTGGYNASFAWRAMMNMHGWRDQQNLKVGMDEADLNVLLAGVADIDPEKAEAVKKELIVLAMKKKKA